MHRPKPALSFLAAGFLFAGAAAAPLAAQPAFDVAAHYVKEEHRIPMRDGAKLLTAVYRPKDASREYPILMNRTPYGVGPYGAGQLKTAVGPSLEMAVDGWIFVYQDVRGRFLSEGTWKPMTPHRPDKAGPADVDESSDTSDTIAWLLANLKGHNGRVGMWGISYPGFYAAAGMIDAHPALLAVSPQAPAIDMWVGDDFHHHGAFFLAHAFRWLSNNSRPRGAPTTERPPGFQFPTPDGYRFFLEMGCAANAQREVLKGSLPIWDDYVAHPDYDAFWKSQSLLRHLKGIRPAVMTVGGWFDSEDLYGPLNSYRQIEGASPGATNVLVMGPWIHGGWARGEGDRLGAIPFGSRTGAHYRDAIERKFFTRILKDGAASGLAEATVFETGANRWREFPAWPPAGARPRSLHLRAGGALSSDPPADDGATFDEYVSDPRRPVPFSAETRNTMGHEFMIEDQRFAWVRPDVLSYETPPLDADLTVVGPVAARLHVSTTGTDADFVAKLIDVFPGDAADPEPNPAGIRMGHFQMLVRAEVLRARYRDDPSRPTPLEPGAVTALEIPLQDVCHTFRKGHRIMVQIQSSWFPLVDRNPQAFVNVFEAKPSDYRVATQRIHRSRSAPSRLDLLVLENP